MKPTRIIVVVSNPRDVEGLNAHTVATADAYLEGDPHFADPAALILNLCRATSYGSKGYYVSLLADARGQQVLPTVKTTAGLAEPYTRFRALQEAGVPTIDAAEMIMRRRSVEGDGGAVQTLEGDSDRFPIPIVRDEHGELLCAAPGDFVETFVIFGTCAKAASQISPEFERAARAVYNEWPTPLLRMQLVHEAGEWKVAEIASASPHELSEETRAELIAALTEQRRFQPLPNARHETIRASLAVLVDPTHAFSPSSPETIDRLERAAARARVHLARIGPNDLRRLPEYDALFVRAHSNVTKPGFQFALRAEALGMPVVDSTQSTIRCTNKVYLEELLHRAGIPTPATQIITASAEWSQLQQLGLPFVLKLPDGDFSASVHKINTREEFDRHAAEMFKRSPLLIAQEWLPTKFDWRVGVLGGKLLFAARYYMAHGHWQIRTVEKGAERYGRVEAIPRDQAPREVVDLALRAAALVGDGLYGVDLKETRKGPVVIEVNDNPNLDVGYEDTADGDVIYDDIIRFFMDRVDAARQPVTEHEETTPLMETRKPITARTESKRDYRRFQVAGVELEYPIVDRDLNVVSLVEPAFRILAGRATSDVDLGAIGFSNEFADHVLELKTQSPLASTAEIEELLYEGVQRCTTVLRDEFDARLFPTGMHPWFNPVDGRLWTRSGLGIYMTYARLFDVRTHGWMNVHASHVNLPFGNERETIAMLTASSLLIPYLPAIAASSPMHDGCLQDVTNARAKWLMVLQDRVPESCGSIVPEYVDSFGQYRKHILQPMYDALDKIPHASALRSEFFNSRGAILRFSRRALEVRVLDTQECVKMDVAIATFVRWSLKHLTDLLLRGRLQLPAHEVLVEDFHRTVDRGSAARVHAPQVEAGRDSAGLADVKSVLRLLLNGARAHAPPEDMRYLDLVERVIETGSLSERIRAHLTPFVGRPADEFNEAARRLYTELCDCLDSNEPWGGRWR